MARYLWRKTNLAEYNMQFMEDMRRFLKGDEGMLSAFELRNRRNPMEYAVINYMANTNGFTLMDTVSYDRKHNEKNRRGEPGRKRLQLFLELRRGRSDEKEK